jgi:hypothetical protein
MLKKSLPFFFLPLLLAGCSTPFYTTNLTATQQSRTTNNLYTVEVSVASRQETLRWSSIRPQIVVDHQSYPMRPTMLMSNRWEGEIPVAPGTSTVNYHYKFDFDYNAFGKAKSDSSLSSDYTLRIVE